MLGGRMISDWIIDIRDKFFMFRQHRDMSFLYRRCCEISMINGEYLGTIKLKDRITCQSSNLENVVSYLDNVLLEMGLEIIPKKIDRFSIIGFNQENIFDEINLKLKEKRCQIKTK